MPRHYQDGPVRFARLRRLRKTDSVRDLFSETRLHPSMLVLPVFVTEGRGIKTRIDSMPGVNRYSVDMAVEYVERAKRHGIRSFLLFGVPSTKDESGTGAYSPNGLIPEALKTLRKRHEDIVLIADVCLCEYTTHGHCGVVRGGRVDNDRTLPLLSKAAVSYARSGADIVAPSAMMDGQVLAIRRALDGAGLGDTLVMGYSAKYASSFYRPFREAAGSAPVFGDRKNYQVQVPNRREALREMEEDIKEGADILMVKPALAYLDVLSEARRSFNHPIGAYNVSGEYAMVEAASKEGWIDEKTAALEILAGIRRAGADMIVTYFAEKAAQWMKERERLTDPI